MQVRSYSDISSGAPRRAGLPCLQYVHARTSISVTVLVVLILALISIVSVQLRPCGLGMYEYSAILVGRYPTWLG